MPPSVPPPAPPPASVWHAGPVHVAGRRSASRKTLFAGSSARNNPRLMCPERSSRCSAWITGGLGSRPAVRTMHPFSMAEDGARRAPRCVVDWSVMTVFRVWSTVSSVSSARSAATSPCSTGCAAAGSPAARRAAPRASAVPAPCWSPGPTATAPQRGPPSTPAWCRPPAWTARRSSPPRGSGTPRPAAPGAAGDGRSRRVAVWLLHAGFHLLDGRGVLPATAGRPAGSGRRGRAGSDGGSRAIGGQRADPTAPGTRRSRARPERLRPARAVREPVPLHRVPADPGRRVRAGHAGCRPIRCWPACDRPAPAPAATDVTSSQGDFVRPADLAEALDLLAEHPDARLVAGSTDWGVELNIRHARAALTIGIDRLPELRTLDDRRRHHRHRCRADPVRDRARLAGRVPLLAQLFPQFASRLIRNGATLGGNLGTGSPIGDSPPALLALDASLVLASQRRRAGGAAGRLLHRLPADRETAGRADQDHPRPAAGRPDQRVPQDRQAAVRRHLQCGSRVSRCAWTATAAVAEIKIGLGGVAATPMRATATEEFLTGQAWTGETVDAGRRRCCHARAPRSATTGPAPPTAPRCSARRCASSTPRRTSPSSSEEWHDGLDQRHAGAEAADRHGPDRWPTGRSTPRSAWRSRTRAPTCTSPGRRSTPTTWSAGPRTSCTPGRCRRRTRTPGSPTCGSTPATPSPAWSGC